MGSFLSCIEREVVVIELEEKLKWVKKLYYFLGASFSPFLSNFGTSISIISLGLENEELACLMNGGNLFLLDNLMIGSWRRW